NKVFANAQTGNVVLMSQNFMLGEWKRGIHYLIPVLAFAAGVFFAEQIGYRLKEYKRLHWRQIVILFEMVLLGIVGFLPFRYNMLANVLVSFSCAMQVQAFRKVNGYGYASTMCIGNLRSGTESISVYLRSKDRKDLRKAFHYYGIIFVFAIGAGAGGIVAKIIGFPAIWCSCGLLLICFGLMCREHL
ncbi:MAG: DUF1275 domain-containing protein, partial [Lachnospiraceae bacterium]|nr:DUF1275 domain-containing protein [Lachnospiraceae bacterium]